MVADTLVRFWRQRGRDAFFVTGTDEHGDKIAQAAAKAGVEPKAFADRVSGLFRSTWEQIGLQPGWFVRTTDPAHVTFVQDVLRRIHARGDVYFSSYRGLYCTGCERFYQERELVDGVCPDHRTPPVEIAEENYFFRMQRYQEQILALYETSRNGSRPTATGARSWRCYASRSATSASPGPSPACSGASSCRSTTASSPTSGSTRS